MVARHFYKISYRILYVLLAITLITVALFFGVGYNNPVGELNYPLNTDLLLYVTYGMLVLAVLVSLVAVILQFVHAWRQNRKRAYRLASAVGAFVLLMVVALFLGSSDPITIGEGQRFTDAFWLKLTDMFLYSIYFLLGLSVICIVLALAGVFRRIQIPR